jgi:hypothetical protein
MAKLVLTMTMSLDGFFSGSNGELDWMTQAPDPEFSGDNVSFFDRFDRGFIGYRTASRMIPCWLNVAGDPQAPADERDLAEAVNRLHPILVSRRWLPGRRRDRPEQRAAPGARPSTSAKASTARTPPTSGPSWRPRRSRAPEHAW